MPANHDFDDQAEGLRKRMENNQQIIEEKQNESTEIVVSELPSRSEVHSKKEKKKTKIRIRFPLIRLLALIFIIIVCLVATYNLWKDNVQLTNLSVAETRQGDKGNSNIDVVEMKDHEVNFQNEVEVVEPNEDVSNGTNGANVADASVTGQETVEADSQESAVTEKQPSTAENETTSVETKKASNERIVYHKVKAGETLYRISMKYYKSRAGEDIIKRTNGLDGNGTVIAGQVLKIPVK
ncbi:MAG TPA: LysM peptidoglycan-binding domain-containing protein [Bacillus bacterium]|nr:LysM peptidoglycan-binding domain-containing protein [Bacillus sp. (in: firmicutes)]